MDQTIIKRAANLLSVKSLVTLVLTAVFAVMALRETISQDFMTIYAVIIAFYFGTQSQKVQDVVDSATDASSIRAELNRAQALDAPVARSMEGSGSDGNA